MFLPQCDRPSFTLIRNRQSCSTVYLNFHIFEEQTGRQKILHRMITRTPWLQSPKS